MMINIKIFYKLTIILDAQSTQNNKFTIFLQYLKENKGWSWFLPDDNCQRFLQSDTIILDVCSQACQNYPK